MKKSRISNLFVSSGKFVDAEQNIFDALIVDEAHRLNEFSGYFNNEGENQIKEIIHAAKCSIFFIDENQRVTVKDIGRKDEIKRWANRLGAKVIEYELASQFRCNGSDGYISWIDNTLQIRETANLDLEGANYDFKVFDSPNEMFDQIVEKNRDNNKSRVVAGYCWNWISKKDEKGPLYDIQLPEHNFEMKWNLDSDGSLWIIDDDSVTEAGCIHTCQGLELDYVGVIIGPDLTVRDGKVVTHAGARAKTDQSLKGLKKIAERSPAEAKHMADEIIKNTYRTLMTRGMKGCYVYCVDKETGE